MSELVKRTWVYAQHPMDYGIGPCPTCCSHKVQWSEFEKHIWCPLCKKDYIPESNGVFDGPILLEVSALMGISWDRIILATDKLDKFDMKTFKYESEL